VLPLLVHGGSAGDEREHFSFGLPKQRCHKARLERRSRSEALPTAGEDRAGRAEVVHFVRI
jgi:hypothetical protein